MARNFYYGKDATIVRGSAHFAAAISASPESFGLTSEIAAAYAALDALLQSAYLEANTPSTRTSVAVARKNVALRDVQLRAAGLAGCISATKTVSDAQLISLGLQPRPVRAPRVLPSEPPVVRVISVSGRRVKLRISDPSRVDSRSKPESSWGAQLYSFVGNDAPSDPDAYHYEGPSTRMLTEMTFPDRVENGATVWLSACWVSRRGGKRGRCSEPISFTLQGGASLPAAA